MRRAALPLGLLALVAACSSKPEVAASGDTQAASTASEERALAFENVKGALADDARASRAVKTVAVTVGEGTAPSVITGIVPPKTVNPSRGLTPPSLQGTYWMRGNPLPDYLLSFANFHWTRANGNNYGFLATFAPGSFAWKEKVLATGAAADDFRFVPEACRVPKDDPALAKIARSKSTYDSTRYRRPVAEDFAEMAAAPTGDDGVTAEQVAGFIDGVWQSGQLPLDGAQSVQLLATAGAFYEAKFNADFTEASVIVFGLGGDLQNRVPVQIGIPEEIASFSLAPHPTDRDIYVRKSFIEGLSTVPNYYLLTRIVDADGNPTPHFQEFLRCAQARSGGRVLKATLEE